jgi:hypothetical protein
LSEEDNNNKVYAFMLLFAVLFSSVFIGWQQIVSHANAQNMTIGNGTQQVNQTQQQNNQPTGFGYLLRRAIGSGVIKMLRFQNGTLFNGTVAPCLEHKSLLGAIFGKFILQDEKLELLQHNVSQAQAQQGLIKKQDASSMEQL